MPRSHQTRNLHDDDALESDNDLPGESAEQELRSAAAASRAHIDMDMDSMGTGGVAAASAAEPAEAPGPGHDSRSACQAPPAALASQNDTEVLAASAARPLGQRVSDLRLPLEISALRPTGAGGPGVRGVGTAPSSSAICIVCDNRIAFGSIRLEFIATRGRVPRYVHPACVWRTHANSHAASAFTLHELLQPAVGLTPQMQQCVRDCLAARVV